MVCIYCGSETAVTNSRRQRRNNNIWRRRHCQKCKTVFTTHESADLSGLLMVASPSALPKPFSEDILYTDILFALSDRSDRYTAAREVTATIIKKLLSGPRGPVYLATDISSAAAGVLKRLDRRAWLRYVAEHPSQHP